MEKYDEDFAKVLKDQKAGFRVVEPDVPPSGNPDATTPEISSLRRSERDLKVASTESNPVADAVAKYLGSTRKAERNNGPVSTSNDEDAVMFAVRPAHDPRTDEPADAKINVYSKSKKKVILTQG